ncbi:MAG: 5'-methylthioadenosine/adenosylhomocysteine nucleosidase [Eubacteriales bacterium]|nr:5'-methylthioadenosine/adenosylhomocysteine nucleosidase [Eubacteriales bacterium]
MLGFIGAMDEEINGIISELSDISVLSKGGLTFTKGSYKDKEVVVVKAGIGKVNAAMCTQLLIDNFKVDAVINTGIAGSLKKELNIGDIVLSTDAVEYDMDATVFGYKLGQIPEMDIFSFEASEQLRKLCYELASEKLNNISCMEGRILTGDRFVGSKEVKEMLINTFDGSCCEMEGAAIAHVCYLNSIPFLIIRAISDSADDSATMNYTEFEQLAANNSIALSLSLIEAY